MRSFLVATATAALLLPVSMSPTASAGASSTRAAERQITYTQWDGGAQWRQGAFTGTRLAKGRLAMKPASATPATRSYAGRRYESGRWDSPWVSPGFGLTRLIASWSASTPGDTWVEIKVRGRAAAGATSSWDVLGRWTSSDRYTQRRSVSGQTDDLARVNVDTWEAADAAGLTAYQIRVQLHRKAGSKASPSVDVVGAVASRLPAGRVPTSAPGPGRGVVLDLPRYSQMIHRGHSPQWGGGGQAWCSPTSTSMVLGYYDALPEPSAYRWVPAGHPDPWVDHAARQTFDYDYDGAGNWPFNTAYAAPLAGKAFVTRLRSLREAEDLIVAGIPVIVSISFSAGELTGAPISATDGHVLVVVGFTDSGDVVVNDPAASASAGVRRIYDRAQFENAWLPTSGGTAYVIHDRAHRLPPGHTNW
ncbi:MAG: peptidase C39 family protein [Nocardioides sp.]